MTLSIQTCENNGMERNGTFRAEKQLTFSARHLRRTPAKLRKDGMSGNGTNGTERNGMPRAEEQAYFEPAAEALSVGGPPSFATSITVST